MNNEITTEILAKAIDDTKKKVQFKSPNCKMKLATSGKKFSH